MHGFCIRSTWIVSTSRPWLGFAANSNHRLTNITQTVYPSRFLSSARLEKTQHLAPSELPVTPKINYEFTAAQVARAASQAVRVAIREGKVRDAYYVVNSMLQAPMDTRIKPLLPSLMLFKGMSFGRPLPSRLAAHSLIHSLLHEGLTLEAGREIQKMIGLGVRFHTRTLEANVTLLCSGPASRVPDVDGIIEKQTTESLASWGDSDASRLLLSQSTRLIPETHLALNILSTARQSRHGRTHRMYGRLVDACLLQGEIVVATLLFVILVKDWQLRRVMRPSPVEPEEVIDVNRREPFERVHDRLLKYGLPSLVHAKRLGLDNPSVVIPYPDKTIMRSILNSINHHILSRDSLDENRLGSIESLSIIATLLRQQSLPFGQISPLLRTLQNCPSSPPCRTGVFQHGRYTDVDVYDQVHEILFEVCERLSTSNPTPSLERPNLHPRLDVRAYNCLLHYALRHRLSPALANRIIEHMTVHRKPPLHPDIVTYNTLLRSASLLHRNDIAGKVLEKLRERQENSNHIITRIEADTNSQPRALQKHKWFSPKHTRLRAEGIAIPDFIETSRRPFLRPDLYTLSSYITYLVSTGRPEVVAKIIFELLPELHIIDHPAGYSPSTQPWTPEQVQERRKACIARAVEYGPYVFTTLLNALNKAGKTGLAERVWLLARQAERASWMPRNHLDAPAPWCLPIHAYTSILQCYANESKKGLAYIRGTRFSIRLTESLAAMQEGPSWFPPRNQRGQIFVKGWAYFFLKMQAREQGYQNANPPLRWTTARSMGWLLHSAMRNGAISVWQELMNAQPHRLRQLSPQRAAQLQSLELPVPDARFFNVVLDIFGRRPHMQMRRVRASPSWWNRKLRITQQHFARTGWLSLTHDHALVEIARGMAEAGYTLPLGLQRVLVGRVTFQTRKPPTQKYQVRPWAFSTQGERFHPFTLPITRTRGLPMRQTSPRPWKTRRGPGRRRKPKERVYSVIATS